jgi:hypothetical protein
MRFSGDVGLDVERVFVTASETVVSNPLKAPMPFAARRQTNPRTLHIMKQLMAVVSAPLSLRMRKRRKTPNLTIHQSCMTANFYDGACGCVATDFQLFGANTAGQNVRVGCVKLIPT